jgi:predicted small secreted protein
MLGMKKFNYLGFSLLAVALVCATLTGCETSNTTSGSAATAAPNPNGGRLVINRAANLGTDLTLYVSIDGKQVGQLPEGQSYSGSMSPGPHVVSCIVQPNRQALNPTQKRVSVAKGQTYTFTAMWKAEKLVLM